MTPVVENRCDRCDGVRNYSGQNQRWQFISYQGNVKEDYFRVSRVLTRSEFKIRFWILKNSASVLAKWNKTNRKMLEAKNILFSLKTIIFNYVFSLKMYFLASKCFVISFVSFCETRNTAIFAIFEYTENIALKLDQIFCKIIVPSQILIEYLIMFTERIALLLLILLFDMINKRENEMEKNVLLWLCLIKQNLANTYRGIGTSNWFVKNKKE